MDPVAVNLLILIGVVAATPVIVGAVIAGWRAKRRGERALDDALVGGCLGPMLLLAGLSSYFSLITH